VLADNGLLVSLEAVIKFISLIFKSVSFIFQLIKRFSQANSFYRRSGLSILLFFSYILKTLPNLLFNKILTCFKAFFVVRRTNRLSKKCTTGLFLREHKMGIVKVANWLVYLVKRNLKRKSINGKKYLM